MPTYQYTCTDCGTPLEAVQSFSDDALTVCPTCTGRLRKVYSAVGVVFKGSGFYKNDSRPKEKASSSSGKDGGSGQDSSSKDGGAKDSPSKDGGAKDSGSKDGGSKERSTTKADGGSSDKPAAKKESTPAAKSTPSKPAST